MDYEAFAASIDHTVLGPETPSTTSAASSRRPKTTG
jgi:hypothetical protein